MRQADARAATLLQAYETVQPPSPDWSLDDGAWATRVAREEGPDDDVSAHVARRARHGLRRLAARQPAAARWVERRAWRPAWLGLAVAAGLLFGVVADGIGHDQRINLLAPPMWAVLAWNLVVYAVLLGHGLAASLRRPARAGALTRLARRLVRRLGGGRTRGAAAAPWPLAERLWLQRSAGLTAARAAGLLHAAAAALAVGLIGGLYLRGLVLDYRAGWESTFLGPDAARAALAFVLAPASALSGIAVPDAAAFAAMRATHDNAVLGGAPAAPWIHLLALTLVLVVLLPRALLAGAELLRARWLAAHLKWPGDDPYWQRLGRDRHGHLARAWVQPYAAEPAPASVEALRRGLADVLGAGFELSVAAPTGYGGEDLAGGAVPPAPTTLVIALHDLASTPEAETHGRHARQLATRAPPGVPTVLCVDEAGFLRRFGRAGPRLRDRRAAWQAQAEALGTLPVFIDAAAPDAETAQALRAALRQPVSTGG